MVFVLARCRGAAIGDRTSYHSACRGRESEAPSFERLRACGVRCKALKSELGARTKKLLTQWSSYKPFCAPHVGSARELMITRRFNARRPRAPRDQFPCGCSARYVHNLANDAKVTRFHGLYGRDQSLSDILDGLIMRLGEARILYGPGRSLPEAVSGICYLLDEMRKLYGSDSIEEILAGIIDRKRRLNRLVELKAVGMVTVEQHHEIEFLERVRRRYICNLAKQKEQEHKARATNGKAPKLPALPAPRSASSRN
jgi:hypothetical protein